MIYLDMKTSLLKFCNDQKFDDSFIPFDFDAHATLEQLPQSNLVGIAEYQLQNNDRHYVTSVLITIATLSTDVNLKVLAPAMAKMFDILVPGYSGITVVNPSGTRTGSMVVMDNVKVLPVARINSRPIQMLALRLASAFPA